VLVEKASAFAIAARICRIGRKAALAP
jgi:hypothetical protein